MSYVRPANKKELTEWFLYRFAEDGSDRIDGIAVEEIVDALIYHFDVIGTFHTAL